MSDLLASLFNALAPLWEMSLTAAYAAAIVALLRLVLKKRAPRQVLCLLWLVVFARLLIPVSLESPLSIVPDAPQVQLAQELPARLAGSGQNAPAQGQGPVQNPAQNPAQGQPSGVTANPVSQGGVNTGAGPVLTAPDGAAPAGPQPEPQAGFPWPALLAGVWLAGALAMCGYGLISWLRLKSRLYDAIRAQDGAWEHPAVGSPFILGVLRPRIYLPAGLCGMPRKFILCHERAHLRRLDHIVKPVCWLALALHWFNPFVWMAFLLMSRDIEAACDEAVIRRLGPKVKADYSATLLSLATNGRIPAPCPLAFDEGDAKGRIKNVLRYRRPALWIVVVSAVTAVMAAVCLLTDPVSAQAPGGSGPDPDPSASQAQDEGLNALLDPWMEEVLNGERQFISAYSKYSQGDGRAYSIHDLRTFYYGDDQYPDERVELGKLAVIDLDRDGVNEMVIWPEGDYEYLYSNVGYLILRRQGDEIYGYNPVYRAFGLLKSDGTFHWDNSAFEGGYATLTFEPGEVVLHETTYHKPGESEIDQLYFVDGQKATREEFGSAVAAQDAKPEPAWYVFEDGRLKYAPINVPIPLDEDVLSAPVPGFLTADQQTVYRQTLSLYTHLFGGNTEAIEEWPDPQGRYGGEVRELNGGQFYTPTRSIYGNWNDFQEAVLSVFTQEYWDARNNFGDEFVRIPIFIGFEGQLHYIAAARGGGGYNANFPETFRLVEQTEDTISFVMTGYYSEPHIMYGETSEERDARVASGWEYSIEFPMRMVRTQWGWRFDEFHCAWTDDGATPFYNQMVPNPDILTSPADGVELARTNDLDLEEGADDVSLRLVDGRPRLVWHSVGYPIDEAITEENFGSMFARDFDGDGQTEVAITYRPSQESRAPLIVMYDFLYDGALSRAVYDVNELLMSVNKYSEASYDPATETVLVSYGATEAEGHYSAQSFTVNGHENLLNSVAGIYANGLTFFYCGGKTFNIRFEPVLADAAMRELDFITTEYGEDGELLPQRTQYASHYLYGQSVAEVWIGVQYDGEQFVYVPFDSNTILIF